MNHRHGPAHHRHRRGRHGFGPEDFGFGPGFGRGPGRGGRRAGRGDVRAAALLLLEEEPRNGYALMQRLEELSEGAWRPSPGSMYPALALLADEGLVREQPGEGSGRLYELTDAGRAHLAEHRETLGEPWKALGGDLPQELRELRDLARDVVRVSMRQIASEGTDEQRAKAVALLTETRRGLYRILAGDDV